MGAPSARVSELSQHWVKGGHDVTVLTGFPNHPDGVLKEEYRRHFWRFLFRERMHRVNIVRTWLLPISLRTAFGRLLNYSSFFASASIAGLFLRKPDIVIASSPQLLVGLAGWWIARIKRVPFVFEVRDLWPESLVAVGASSANSAIYRFLERIAAFLYRRADRIVVVTPAFRDHLVRRWQVPPEKICVVPNGVETEIFRPQAASAPPRRELNAKGEFVVSFIGTVGLAHGLDTLVAAAEKLQATEPSIQFLVVGEGADRERIVELAKEKGISNIRFVPQQPREKIPEYVAASDTCLVLLKKSEVFETVIPTKMLEFMSCARPVILGVKGQAREIMERARAGICIEPEDAEALCDAILKLRNDANLRSVLGQNGRDYILRNFSRDSTATEYLLILNEMLGNMNILEAAVA
jgi:colanic acid biosynthesis glycosyl transferase WcaI